MLVLSREIHPAAALFPMLPDADLQELAADIHRNGLLEPIVLCEEKILDGRNRFAACELSGVTPRFIEWDGVPDSPTLYVLSKNLHRRQLSKSQMIAIAAESLPLLREEASRRMKSGVSAINPRITLSEGSSSHTGKAVEIAAKQVGVGSASVWRAEQVKNADPVEFERVKSGETTVNTAYRQLKAPPVSKATKQERIDQIRELAATGSIASQIAAELSISSEYVRDLAKEAAISLPDAGIGRQSRKLNVNRIIDETVLGAQALVAGLELVDDRIQHVDQTKAKAWIDSLHVSVGALNRLIRQLQRRNGA